MWQDLLFPNSLGVILISAYNRYADLGNTYYRAGQYSPQSQMASAQRRSRETSTSSPESGKSESSQRTVSPHGRPQNSQKGKPLSFLSPDFLTSLLPSGLDAGDLLLAVMLFLLYIDTHDEDFLIILIVVGFSMFKGSGSQF